METSDTLRCVFSPNRTKDCVLRTLH